MLESFQTISTSISVISAVPGAFGYRRSELAIL